MRSLAFLAKPFIDYVINTKGYPKYRYHLIYPLLLAVIIMYFSDRDIIKLVTNGLTALSFISGFSFAALIAFPSIMPIPMMWITHSEGSGSLIPTHLDH